MYSIQRGSTLPLQNALIESANTAALNTSKPIFTVLAGHNAFSFDIPILLQNSGDSFITELSPINVRFADTLTLFKSLIKSKHHTMENGEAQCPKAN